jgi:predicted ATPase
MPIIQSFCLKNFKGIEQVDIDLLDRTRCPVITLIGLNESGKTTILEGLSHFVSGDKSVSGLFQGVHSKASGTGLIPVHKKAAFSSNIEIIGTVQLDDADIKKAQTIASKFSLVINENELLKPFTITKQLRFEDSALNKTTNFWKFSLQVRTERGTKFKAYARPKEGTPDLWLEIANQLEEDLPQVSYFPTFLVDMPNRIYLREHDQELAVNRHYRYVFQDILDSLGEDLSLEKHVCKRIADFKASEKSANWFSIFFGGPSKAPVDSVFQKISNAVTRQVLGSWQRVFQRAISAKSIFVEWNIDTEKGDLPYASFYVSDGESRYAISERSLGFRWFFSFLLFTAFKQAKERATIFIFDEPAANLHAKAQAELMTSFSKIASEGNRIIYSTHSHHMINPSWLSGAYIVENTALDYDVGDSFGLSSKPTNVQITKYRDFVSQYPTRSSYFQPVIEKLEYASPEVIGTEPFVIVEGVSDYYALRLAALVSNIDMKFRLMPGVGAGSCGPLICLLLGRGERFVILLDDDKTGRKEAERYRSEWFLDAESVFTLGDVDTAFEGMQLETLLTTDTLKHIETKLGMNCPPNKKQIGWYLAEMCAANPDTGCLSPNTLTNLCKVLTYLDSKFC